MVQFEELKEFKKEIQYSKTMEFRKMKDDFDNHNEIEDPELATSRVTPEIIK